MEGKLVNIVNQNGRMLEVATFDGLRIIVADNQYLSGITLTPEEANKLNIEINKYLKDIEYNETR